MKDTFTISTFLKFGHEEHVQQLVDHGIMYCNTVDFFKVLEDKSVRGDKMEFLSKITNLHGDQIKNFSMKVSGNTIDLHPSHLQLREREQYPYGNLFCMYHIRPDHFQNQRKCFIDPLTQNFGSHFMMVTDCVEFDRRVRLALVHQKLEFSRGVVDYYDLKTYNGKLSPFHKSNEYAYQREFRILIKGFPNEPILINIGSLKDITMIFETKRIPEIHFEFQKSKDQSGGH